MYAKGEKKRLPTLAMSMRMVSSVRRLLTSVSNTAISWREREKCLLGSGGLMRPPLPTPNIPLAATSM